MTTYETVIGIETHVQLRTKSKLFCGCPVLFGAPPNSATCPVCLGHPGTLPVLNRAAFEQGMKAALALGGTIASFTKFDRKNYFYPDLPKNYQISQYDRPLAADAEIRLEGRTVRILRIHLEEDAGKLVHEEGGTRSFVDLNRCGTPLAEIVTHPDLRSADETHAYLTELKTILQYSGVSDCDMEKGELRCDVNLSLRPHGSTTLGVKTEVKNLNSFRHAKMAIEHEEKRQAAELDAGRRIVSETRLFDPVKNETRAMRSKEEAHDYRYFPEPDLPPVVVPDDWIDRCRRTLPEMPAERRRRFREDLGLREPDAALLAADRAWADFFEKAAGPGDGPVVAKWMINDLSRALRSEKKGLTESALTPELLAELIGLVGEGTITAKTGKELLPELVREGRSPARLVKDRGLAQLRDAGLLGKAVRDVIAAQSKAVADFRGGKESSLQFLIGQVMRETRGKANPKGAEEELRKQLAEG